MDTNRVIRQCKRLNCGFRFPQGDDREDQIHCPICGALTQIIRIEYPAKIDHPSETKPYGPVLEVLLDNIRSTYNVGAMFRSADGAGVRRLHLCGVTPTPLNPKVAKTSLGAERAISWAYHPDGLDATRSLKARGFTLWALESTPRAISIFKILEKWVGDPVALIVGNEVNGIDPEILSLCDFSVAIPMVGIKSSLNVAIAFGIAVYLIRFNYPTPSSIDEG